MARVANELAPRFALCRFSASWRNCREPENREPGQLNLTTLFCVRDRLKQLSARLGDADWLDGAFSAGRPHDGQRAAQAEIIEPAG
jgi:hypothetical protein